MCADANPKSNPNVDTHGPGRAQAEFENSRDYKPEAKDCWHALTLTLILMLTRGGPGRAQAEFENSRDYKPEAKDWLSSYWAGFNSPNQIARIRNTGVPMNFLKEVRDKSHAGVPLTCAGIAEGIAATRKGSCS